MIRLPLWLMLLECNIRLVRLIAWFRLSVRTTVFMYAQMNVAWIQEYCRRLWFFRDRELAN